MGIRPTIKKMIDPNCILKISPYGAIFCSVLGVHIVKLSKSTLIYSHPKKL